MQMLSGFVSTFCIFFSTFNISVGNLKHHTSAIKESNRFSYQVGLFAKICDRKFFWCGGSLIAKNWVLTAAHCMDGVDSVLVYLGATNIASGEVTYNVSKANIIIHPDWDADNMLNDISLIKIPSVPYSTKIKPVRLPQLASSYSTYAGEYAVASGWGRIRESVPDLDEDLHWRNMKVITNFECFKTFTLISSRDLCASTLSSSSVCMGDSGGPLVLESSGVQIGISSFGVADSCRPEEPSGFMRVTSYLKWIKSHIDFCDSKEHIRSIFGSLASNTGII